LRLRDHAADCASQRPDQLLCTHRALAGRWRLSRVLATATHDRRGTEGIPARGAGRDREPRRQWRFRRRAVLAGDDIYFSEVSPRPHDTGLVTLISQDLSEFALHARAILGLPIPVIRQKGPSASCALLVEGESNNVRFENVDRALTQPDTALRL